MTELGAVRKYLYWSERRIRAVAEDNAITLAAKSATTVRTPPVPGLPQFERTRGPRSLTRHEIACRIEDALGQVAVTRFVTPPSVRFAKGQGTVRLSEFPDSPGRLDVPADVGVAAILAPIAEDDNRLVGVCLFGSMSNFADVITDSVPQRTGWSSSAGPGVMRAIRNRCRLPPPDEEPMLWPYDRAADPEVLAIEAANVAFGQGEGSGSRRLGFTYGEVNDVGEWMAEIWLDVVCPHPYGWGAGPAMAGGGYVSLHRILVGAPLWIRTPSVRAMRLYDEPAELPDQVLPAPLRARVAATMRALRGRPEA